MVMAMGIAGCAAIRRRPFGVDVGFGVVVATGLLVYLLFCSIAINVEVRYVLTVWPMIMLSALLVLLIPASILLARQPALPH